MKHLLTLMLFILIISCKQEVCIKGHYEMVIMPITIVDSKGRVSIAYMPQQIYICDSSKPIKNENIYHLNAFI